MKLAACVVMVGVLAACRGGDPAPGGASSGAPAGTGPGAGAGATAASESFFAGDAPAEVKLKPTKSFAIEPGVLLFQPVASWNGGTLPGYDYMSMSKDQAAVFRVASSTGVVAEMGCSHLATPMAMAPARVKNLKPLAPAKVTAVGKNKFAAKEGSCTGDGPKGAVEIHFIDIARESNDGVWHYGVMVSFPADATAELKNEARAFARSLEFTGRNGTKL